MESVVTILDVPLVASADLPIAELAQGVPTLEGGTIALKHAREELSTSPVYRDLVLSRDSRTTALLVNAKTDEDYLSLLEERNELLIKRGAAGLSPEDQARFERVSTRYDVARAELAERRHAEIAELRAVIADHRDGATLHLGGVSMIADDMVTFVRRDLVAFGSGVLVFIVVLLTVIFRSVRWVLLPLLSCFYAGTMMVGMLGLMGWAVTVISSNF
ncbi:MAG: MMPL family transporter, partial [Myxococcota bacterium]